jgi:hypothetical protein
MPVSPADFYAYSQATGVQVPDSPEERAQLAPQVLQFRRNQLKPPQEQGIDPMSMGVGIGLALAGAGAGALALRGRNRIPKSTKTTGQSGVKVEDLNTDIINRVANVGKSKEPTRQDVYQQVASKSVEDLPPVTRPQGGAETELIVDTQTGEVFRSGGGRPYANVMTSADLAAQVDEAAQNISQNALTDFQKRQAPVLSDQQINAVESGEDQMTGRVRQQLQRNEDLNLMQVDALEDVNQQMAPSSSDAPITQAAAQTVDGIPVDQAEGVTSAQRFFERERDEIASELGEQNIVITPSRIEKELAQRVSGSTAWQYGPKYTQRKQALQLGATYDPRFFDNPTLQQVTIAGEQVPVSFLKQSVAMPETAAALQEKVEKKKDWLGSVRLKQASETAKANRELINVNRDFNNLLDYQEELTSFVNSGRGTQEQKTRAMQRLDDVGYELDRLDARSDELNQIVAGGKSGAGVRGAQRHVEEYISNLELPKALKPGIEEGQRLFFEVDPQTGKPIPGTQELRSEKYAIELEPKSGGGRKAVEFDPEGQSGQSKDIYGVRKTTDRPDDPSLRPSQPKYSNQELLAEMTKNEMGLNPEMISVVGKTGSGDVPVAGDYDTALKIAQQTIERQPVTEVGRRSVLMSEAVRKAARQRSERNPMAGKIPSEMTMRRRQMETMAPQVEQLGPRIEYSESATPPQQLGIEGVTGYAARQRKSPADIASQQLESYMKKRMAGRSTPLTSEAVIQPKLF